MSITALVASASLRNAHQPSRAIPTPVLRSDRTLTVSAPLVTSFTPTSHHPTEIVAGVAGISIPVVGPGVDKYVGITERATSVNCEGKDCRCAQTCHAQQPACESPPCLSAAPSPSQQM